MLKFIFYASIASLFTLCYSSDVTVKLILYDIKETDIEEIPINLNQSDHKLSNVCKRLKSGDSKMSMYYKNVNETFQPFQCCYNENCLPIFDVFKYISDGFERNLPFNWYELSDDPPCFDSFNRPIILPRGMKGCKVFQQSFSKGNVKEKVSGGLKLDARSYDLVDNYSCGLGYEWTNGIIDGNIGDNKCILGFGLFSMEFVCCCYHNTKKCQLPVSMDKLICPMITNVDERYEGSVSQYKIVSIDELQFRDQCFIKIEIGWEPDHRGKIPESLSNNTIISTTIEHKVQSICRDVINANNFSSESCFKFERLCYHDINDTTLICCRFYSESYSKDNGIYMRQKVNKTGILDFHDQYILEINQIMQSLELHKNCMHKYENLPSYCVYFYDKWLNAFVNIKFGRQINDSSSSLDTNFLLDPYEIERIRQLETEAIENGFKKKTIQFQGRIDKNKYQNRCGKQNFSLEFENLPEFYNFTILAVYCKTDGSVCDNHKHYIGAELDSVANLAKSEYACFVGDSNGKVKTEFSWDPHCISSVIHGTHRVKYGITDRKEVQNELMLKLQAKDDRDDEYYCITSYKHGSHSPDETVCICQNERDSKDHPCNHADYVIMLDDMETKSEFIVDNMVAKNKKLKNYCTISEINTNQICHQNNELGYKQQCTLYFRDHVRDSECSMYTYFTAMAVNYRMENNGDWHSYLICKEYKPEIEPFRCIFVDDFKKDSLKRPTIVCCCHAEYCEELYYNYENIHIVDIGEMYKLHRRTT